MLAMVARVKEYASRPCPPSGKTGGKAAGKTRTAITAKRREGQELDEGEQKMADALDARAAATVSTSLGLVEFICPECGGHAKVNLTKNHKVQIPETHWETNCGMSCMISNR